MGQIGPIWSCPVLCRYQHGEPGVRLKDARCLDGSDRHEPHPGAHVAAACVRGQADVTSHFQSRDAHGGGGKGTPSRFTAPHQTFT
eukprot:scaffold7878_cov126-Isochrysis_galbana.AAC.4